MALLIAGVFILVGVLVVWIVSRYRQVTSSVLNPGLRLLQVARILALLLTIYGFAISGNTTLQLVALVLFALTVAYVVAEQPIRSTLQNYR